MCVCARKSQGGRRDGGEGWIGHGVGMKRGRCLRERGWREGGVGKGWKERGDCGEVSHKLLYKTYVCMHVCM